MRIPLLLAEVAHKSTPFNTLEHGAYERIENKTKELSHSHIASLSYKQFIKLLMKITYIVL